MQCAVVGMAVIAAGPLAAQPAGLPASAVHIRGNWVLNAETYLTILQMPPSVLAGENLPGRVRRRLLDFLHRSGYELAEVRVRRFGAGLDVQVDEGRLARVLFLGTGSLRALQLKMQLDIPQNVFNRPNLERQLRQLRERYGIDDVHFELVACEPVRHHGPQVEDLGKLEGRAVIPPAARHELHIHLGRAGWSTGLGINAGYDFPDGLDLGAAYRGRGLLFDDDRWLVGALVGGKLRENIDDKTVPALTRAKAEVRWFTPALIGRGLRPHLWLGSDLVSRQRRDLDVEIFYYRESLEGSLNLGYELVPGLMVSAGGGVEYRLIFGGEPKESVEDDSWLRPFVMGRLDFVFDPERLRKDRRHRLMVEGRHIWVDGVHSLGRIRYLYRKLFDLGWHDLLVSSRGVWLGGRVLFDDEEPVGGRYLRGVFGGSYWVTQVANLSLEFRFSLARDLFKISLFHDLAVFGELDRMDSGQTARVADSFGLGFHALILDMFQLDLYYAFGFSSDGSFDHGVAAGLSKVF